MLATKLGSHGPHERPSRVLGLLGLALLAAIQVAACSGSDDEAADFSAGVGGLSGTGATGSGTGTGGTFTGEPPEEEQEDEFQAPVASGRFLWAANPASNRVALVDAESLDVASLEAGYTPTYLAALPAAGGRTAGAAVINVNGRDVTLFSLPEGDVEVDAKSVTTLTLPLYGAANAWKVSAKGAFAIAWTNAKDLTAADPTEGFQDVTVIDRRSDAPSATRLSVGYRPTQVFIDEDEAFAFVVSEPGISVIDLTADGGPAVVRELFLPEQTLDAPRDVSFVPSGQYAFVRVEGEKKIHIVDTASDTRKVVTLPAAATDLDVSRDGDRAVVVMRAPTAPAEPVTGASGSAGAPVVEEGEPSRVAVLPVATIVSDPATFDLYEIDEFFGSAVVSKDGKRALLFTNAVAHDTLGILDLDTGSHRELDLKAPVKAAYLTSDGNNAVALLSPPEDSVKLGAFALVPVDKVLPPRIEGTDAPTFLVALSTTPARALVTTRDDVGSAHATYLASFPSLSVDRVDLPSKPLASGMVPEAGKGFVAEQHEEGRVTFVDLADGSARTLTGFELGSKVVDGE